MRSHVNKWFEQDYAKVAAAVVFLIIISGNEYEVVKLAHLKGVQDHVSYALDILSGRPQWRAFQNRLLGPALFSGLDRAVDWISYTSPTLHSLLGRLLPPGDSLSMNLFFAIGVTTINFLTFGLLLRMTGSYSKSMALTALGAILFLLLSDYWLYTWDIPDVLIFTCLAFLIFAPRMSYTALVVLFIVALVNRESAAFVGLWLVCLGVSQSILDGKVAVKEIAVGVSMIVLTALYVKLVRELLFIETNSGLSDGEHALIGNHVLIVENLRNILANFVRPKIYVNFYILVVVVVGIKLLAIGQRERDATMHALGLFLIGLLGNVLMFGMVNEARVFLLYIPFVVFSAAIYGTHALVPVREPSASTTLPKSPDPSSRFKTGLSRSADALVSSEPGTGSAG